MIFKKYTNSALWILRNNGLFQLPVSGWEFSPALRSYKSAANGRRHLWMTDGGLSKGRRSGYYRAKGLLVCYEDPSKTSGNGGPEVEKTQGCFVLRIIYSTITYFWTACMFFSSHTECCYTNSEYLSNWVHLPVFIIPWIFADNSCNGRACACDAHHVLV